MDFTFYMTQWRHPVSYRYISLLVNSCYIKDC